MHRPAGREDRRRGRGTCVPVMEAGATTVPIGRRRFARLAMVCVCTLGLGGAGAVAAFPAPPAGAVTPPTCTWTGALNDDWSVAGNWTGGAACSISGGPQAGAAIIFPAVNTTETVDYDLGTESGGGGTLPARAFDSITFEDKYQVLASGGPASITLTPTAATPC